MMFLISPSAESVAQRTGPRDTALQNSQRPHRYAFCAIFALALLLILIALFAPYLAPFDPNAQNAAKALRAPDAVHIAGTDALGRDLFSRTLMGMRTSLGAALLLVATVSSIGTFVGVLAAMTGGKWDAFFMRGIDLCLSFPALILALAIAAVHPGGIGGIEGAMLALTVVATPKYARLARASTLSLLRAPFLLAARLSCCTPLQLACRHILPNIAGPLLVTATLDISTLLMELAGLSFLGLGAQPPTAELGSMLNVGRSLLQTHPHVLLAPSIATVCIVAVFHLLGDAVRDRLAPKTNHHGTPYEHHTALPIQHKER